jgi:hypothetical protein
MCEFTATAVGLKNAVSDDFPTLAGHSVIIETLGGEAV